MIDRASESGAETGQVRAAIGVRDRVGEAQNLVVVGVVVLENNIRKYVIVCDFAIVVDLHLTFARESDRCFMNDRFVFAELRDELHNALSVVKGGLFRGFRTLIFEINGQPRIEECQFAQTGGKSLEIEHDGINENRRIGEKGNLGSGFVRRGFADHRKWRSRLATLKRDHVDLAVAADFRFEPIRERVHALRAHAVQTTRVFVGTLAKLTTSVEIRENEFDRRDAKFRVRINGNAATVV